MSADASWMSFVQQLAPTLLAPGVQVRTACATIVPGFGSVTVEPIRKVMFAFSGARADAGAARAALATATVTIPVRILHLRIAPERYTCHKDESTPRTCQLAPGIGR